MMLLLSNLLMIKTSVLKIIIILFFFFFSSYNQTIFCLHFNFSFLYLQCNCFHHIFYHPNSQRIINESKICKNIFFKYEWKYGWEMLTCRDKNHCNYWFQLKIVKNKQTNKQSNKKQKNKKHTKKNNRKNSLFKS